MLLLLLSCLEFPPSRSDRLTTSRWIVGVGVGQVGELNVGERERVQYAAAVFLPSSLPCGCAADARSLVSGGSGDGGDCRRARPLLPVAVAVGR